MTITLPQEDYSAAPAAPAAPAAARPPKWYYDDARAMAREGVTRTRIAEALGVSSHSVKAALHLVDGVRGRRRLFDRAYALRLRTEGLSNRKIAKLLGVTHVAVLRALRRSS